MNEIYDYAEANLRFFPLWSIIDGKCECGDPECTNAGKHPRPSNWPNVPHWSDEQTEAMLQYTIKTGAGIALDNHVVIDIDPRNNGDKSFKQLVKDTGIDFMKDAGFIVKTGGGGYHIYYSVPEGVALYTHIEKYIGIDFKGKSSYVVAAGSLHASGNRYEYEKGYPQDITEAPQILIDILRKKEHHRAIVNNQSVDVTDEEIAEYLSHVTADTDYETWIRCGMAIHHSTNGAGFELWDNWSNQSDKYPGRSALDKHWHSFGKSSTVVTLGTLIHYAEEYGYQLPVTFEPIEEAPTGDHPFPIDTIDLLRPPGFVGEVAKWINDQCRFPREHLSSVASLVTIGNIAGLRYTDDIDGVTANLFAFAVAASGTGKESVQQAMAELHRAAGIQSAVHGSIKSEQEVIRNLIRHQAAFYIIDEIGILLQKIVNAQKRGGAVYLDGVIGILMSAYSKADGFMLLTGDTKEEVRKMLASELAQCRKLVSENEDKNGAIARRIPNLEIALDNLDNGLEKPFLSVMGYSTNVTFDDIVTFEQATNGFIGRSILSTEKETNPKRKKGFKKVPISDRMSATLQNLYKPGTFNMMANHRIEHYGDRVKIKTDSKAADMLESVADWIEEYAEQHKSRTGLEAIVRRGYELCSKVSLILAIPEGVRNSEHVRWAYALMRRDIEDKIMLAHGNTMGMRKDANSQGEALAMKIIGLLDGDHGETKGVIHNRCRRWQKQDIDTVLDRLESDRVIERRTGRIYKGKAIDKYYKV